MDVPWTKQPYLLVLVDTTHPPAVGSSFSIVKLTLLSDGLDSSQDQSSDLASVRCISRVAHLEARSVPVNRSTKPSAR